MNGYIKRSVWITTTLLGCLTLASSAQAASFDCAKAQTKVEHLICDNPEISTLDDEMSTAYKVSLKSEKQGDSIRQAQKQWVKNRNACQDAACIRRIYQARINELTTSKKQSSLSSQPGVESAGFPATAKKYPPYPDVWQWVLPDREKLDEDWLSLSNMDNGDVLLTYLLHGHSGALENAQPITLFGNQSVMDKDAGLRIYSRELRELRLSDGTTVHPYFEENFGLVSLANGYRLRHYNSLDGGGLTGCYRGPAQDIYQIEDLAGKPHRSVVIFKLLDKPKHVHIEKGCAYEPDGDFTTRVESVSTWKNIPLADGGFVMLADKGIVLRFDKDFNSHASLINDRYFVLDMSVRDDWIYINRVTRKDYRLELGKQYLREALPYDYQAVVNDLYQYLLALKTKKGAAK